MQPLDLSVELGLGILCKLADGLLEELGLASPAKNPEVLLVGLLAGLSVHVYTSMGSFYTAQFETFCTILSCACFSCATSFHQAS